MESELNANTNCQNDNDGWDGAEVDVEDGHDPEELDDNWGDDDADHTGKPSIDENGGHCYEHRAQHGSHCHAKPKTQANVLKSREKDGDAIIFFIFFVQVHPSTDWPL